MGDHASAPPSNAWTAAARLVARWLERRERIDELLEALPRTLKGAERARCQHLVYGVVRHYGRLEAELRRLVSHPPRFATRAVLFVAGFELIEAAAPREEGIPSDEGHVAKIVHHAVEQTKTLSSPAEARMVNAVVRKLADRLATEPPPKLAEAATLADYFSHPEWLVRRWLAHYGAAATRRLLEWNQQPAPIYARWRAAEAPPDWLKPSAWPGFLEVPAGRWSDVEPLLTAGKLYLQDPATRFAVQLLSPQPGESVLDLCAAPGGKSLLIGDAMAAALPAQAAIETAEPSKRPRAGRIVAMDLPGKRIERLKENLSRLDSVDVALVQGDAAHGAGRLLAEHNLPTAYPAVLLDVPCSNTGVMRHRVDVKWRLQESDFNKHARQQGDFLSAAARLVAPGGRLVYSTCSIDPEENERVVQAFLEKAGQRFKLEDQVSSFPWDSGHDGIAAFRLRRIG